MFAENRKISGHQAFRLLVYDLLGLGTLLIPTVLANVAGRDGIFCIILGTAAGVLYLKLLAPVLRDMRVPFPQYLEEKLGVVAGKIVQIGYLVYFVLLAGYTAWLFSSLVLSHLLREESFWLVLAVVILLTAYGIWNGIEGRARIYELLFWVVLLPLFVMLFAAVDEIDVDYWAPVFTTGVSGFLGGTYYVFVCFALIFLVLFLGEFVTKRETLVRAGRSAMIFAGTVHAGLYLILLGIFGAQALGVMEFPAVTMMSTVKISDGFLKRLDALMFGIWFFTLYAILSSSVFYGGIVLRWLLGIGRSSFWEKLGQRMENILRKRSRKFTKGFGNMAMGGDNAVETGETVAKLAKSTEREQQRQEKRKSGENPGRMERMMSLVVIVTAFTVAEIFYRSEWVVGAYERFLWYAGTPFLVLVPLVLVLRILWEKREKKGNKANAAGMCGGKMTAENKKRNRRSEGKSAMKITILLILLLPFGFISGCNTAELEDKNFPIEVAVNENGDFGAEWLGEETSGNRMKDYNHLKVILLSRDFLENSSAMEEFLNLLEQKNEVPRNTYVVAAEDAKEILKLGEGMGESVGTYLEEYLENLSQVKREAYPTLGMLYQEKENKQETLFIPFVTEVDGKPEVDHYYVWKRGEAGGEVDTETALLAYFTANMLEEYTLTPAKGSYVKLFAPRNEISFSEEDGRQRQIVVDVYCSGEVLYQKEKGDQEGNIEEKGKTKESRQLIELERQISEYMNGIAVPELGKWQIDVSNSYKKLGGYQRDWYWDYIDGTQEYEKDVDIVYNVHITWVNL